jgi:hypothetical protein
MKAESPKDLLFHSNAYGKVTHLRGVELPQHLFHMMALASVSDRSPNKDTTWVIRGAYQFAKLLQG